MKFAPIINPDARKEAPKPLRVDLFKAFFMGTFVWLIATVVVFILKLLNLVPWMAVIVCVFGFIIGLLMLIWEHFDRWDYRRLGK
ncbi:DUF2530 domain-containing protein [Gardnerella sp. 2492-Sm]|uniref:DUF2530 domain-containing protein n=1 Tax=unclassified Gardnerella TaxID=2628112 RepID=UPI003CFDDD11